MGTDIMAVVLNANQVTETVQFFNDGFTRFVTIHTCVFSALFVDGRIIIHNIDLL